MFVLINRCSFKCVGLEMICIYFCIWWRVQSNSMFKFYVQWLLAKWFKPPIFLISLWTGTLALCWDFFSFFFSKGLYYSKNVHQIMKTGTPSKFNGHLFPQVWGPWCVKCLTVPTAAYYIFHILTEGCFFSPVYFTEVRRSLKKFKEQAWNYECLIVVVQGTVARSQLRRHM